MGPPLTRRSATSVLVVDDTEDHRDMYERYLRAKGFVVWTAANGADAVALARIESPDIVVLDLAMPGMTGWEVLRELRKNDATAQIPVAVVTGFPGLFATGEALECRADAYLLKPCLPEHLVLEVLRLLQRSS